MADEKFYDTLDCMRLIKKKYPWMPRCIIRRVLFAEELLIGYPNLKRGISRNNF